jgi:hypothetical protein
MAAGLFARRRPVDCRRMILVKPVTPKIEARRETSNSHLHQGLRSKGERNEQTASAWSHRVRDGDEGDTGFARDNFIGVWKPISCERKSADGHIDFSDGEKPVGRITYDNAVVCRRN